MRPLHVPVRGSRRPATSRRGRSSGASGGPRGRSVCARYRSGSAGNASTSAGTASSPRAPKYSVSSPGPAVLWNKRRVEDARHVSFHDEGCRSEKVHGDQRPEPDDHEAMAEPAHPIADEEHRAHRQGRAQRDDRRGDVEAELRSSRMPADTGRVEARPSEHDEGQRGQHEGRRHVGAAALTRSRSRGQPGRPPARHAAATSSKKPRRA